jgi:hypothetical protein
LQPTQLILILTISAAFLFIAGASMAIAGHKDSYPRDRLYAG